jgi:hypothetical protein
MTWARACCLAVTLLTGTSGLAPRPADAQTADLASPTVTILAPSPDSAVTTSATTLDVSGVADDAGGITRVEWTNDRGGSGTASGTASWFAFGIPLQPGVNGLAVTAYGLDGRAASTYMTVICESAVDTAAAPQPASAPARPPAPVFISAPTAGGGAPTTPIVAKPVGGTPSPSQPVSQPATGLVAAYGFEEASGTTVEDLSGNGHTGTLSPGVTWTPQGKSGNALLFHGSGFVTVPDSAALQLTVAMTLEAWVFPTAAPHDASTAVVKEDNGQPAYVLYAGSATSRPSTRIKLASGARGINGPAIIPLNAWTHLASTFDGGVLRLYVNGTLVAAQNFAGTIATSTGALRIGGSVLGGEYFRGRIDDVRIYDRPLSQVEIRADMVTPAGSQTPAVGGQWAGPFTAPIVTVHGTLLRTGKLVVWDALGNGGDVNVWDPGTNAFTKVQNSDSNIFCSGHCALPDGKVMVAGGHITAHRGLTDSNIFDPDTQTWTTAGSMAIGRWYPTVTSLPDGRLLVTAGEFNGSLDNVTIPEIYDPQADTWTQLTNLQPQADIPFYPHMFVLPDDGQHQHHVRVLASSTTEGIIASQILDVDAQTWTVVDPSLLDGGSAVMYLPGRIMKSGTHNDADMPTLPSEATTYVLDMTQPSPAWQETASMAFPRAYHHLTMLPDGHVLATGGGDTTDAIALDGAILPAELWTPSTKTWTTLAAMKTPRLYHNIAVLLPDARVFVSGGGRFFGADHPTDQKSFEVYSPPYLFRGPRPTITSVPATATYGAQIAVLSPDAATIASVVLLKPGSVTHSFNGDQRFVPLSFTKAGSTLNVTMPGDAHLAPPGSYMVFIVDTNGVPSVAKFVKLQ